MQQECTNHSTDKDDKLTKEYLRSVNHKHFRVPCDPTAEKMSEIIFKGLEDSFSKFDSNIQVESIKIWENENSQAGYHRD